MKPFVFLFLFPFTGGILAATLRAHYEPGNLQQILSGPFNEIVLNGQTFDASPAARTGFSLDLREKRLIQMEGKAPVWMTELEKVCYAFLYSACSRTEVGCMVCRLKLKLTEFDSSICEYLWFIAPGIVYLMDTERITPRSMATHERKALVSLLFWMTISLIVFVATYPTPSAHEQVTSVIKTLTTDGPRELLERFSSYRTRCRLCVLYVIHPVNCHWRLQE